jgi:formylmethanofuran dehydrogenase subunit C
VEYNGKYYLEVKVERVLEVTYVRDLDGNVVDYGDIELFLPAKRVNERAETEKNIYPTDYAVENIKKIKIDGVLYEVVAV